jgi:hypothetical protein
MSWSIPSKKKNYLVTLSHFTFDKNRLGEAHLSHLGKRLGITSILLLIPLKEM